MPLKGNDMSLGKATHHFSNVTLDTLEKIGKVLAEHVSDGAVLLLNGQLGAGKTAFTQLFAKALGVTEPVMSPTFNLVHTYLSGSVILHHFDLYRLQDADQLDDIDFWSLIDEDTEGVSVIEWSSKFPDDMPTDALSITFSVLENGSRNLTFTAHGYSSQELLDVLVQKGIS